MMFRFMIPKMCLNVGNIYTREEISQELGGEQQTYLPQKDGKITCGCFNLEENPQAPYIILVGTGEKIEDKAKILSQQQGFIPVFVKRQSNEWKYQGDFVCNRYSTNQEEINVVRKISHRENITGIIYMNKVN